MITTTFHAPPAMSEKEARRLAHVEICRSKMKFQSKGKAKIHCKQSTRLGGDPRLRPYECPTCGLWHTTTQRKR